MAHAVFRCDASPAIGGGHVVRCLTLADMLADLGWRCTFAVAPPTQESAPALSRSRHAIAEIAGGDIVLDGSPDLAVADLYAKDDPVERRIAAAADRFLAIDDAPRTWRSCDYLLDQTLGRVAADYAGFVPVHCRILTGPRHALVRRGFGTSRAAALARRMVTGPVRRILVSLGATDAANATSTALRMLGALALDADIDVVLGPGAPHLASVRELAAGLPRVHLHVDPPDMAALLLAADLAVGAPGGSSWERCVLGLATALITVADNQMPTCAALAATGAAIDLGRHDGLNLTTAARELGNLIGDEGRRRALSQAAFGVCDGLGTFRVILALLPAVKARDGEVVRLRAATLDDGERMLEWQRDPDTRRFARNTAVPDRATHFAWLAARLANAASFLAVVEHGDEPAGIFRLDRLPGEGLDYEVSILTAPRKRGFGIAGAALSLGRQLAPGARLVAEVLPGNLASIELFSRAGYRRQTETMYRSEALH